MDEKFNRIEMTLHDSQVVGLEVRVGDRRREQDYTSRYLDSITD